MIEVPAAHVAGRARAPSRRAAAVTRHLDRARHCVCFFGFWFEAVSSDLGKPPSQSMKTQTAGCQECLCFRGANAHPPFRTGVFSMDVCVAILRGGLRSGLPNPRQRSEGGHAQGATPALVTYLSRRSCTPCWMARLSSETSLPTSTCHTWCVCGREAGEGRARDECRSRGPALTADLHFQHFKKHRHGTHLIHGTHLYH